MRTLTLFRAGWGALLLVRPKIVLARLGGDRSGGVRAAARILGARHLGEAIVLSLHTEDSPAPRWPIVVDLGHAFSMLIVAYFNPRVRRDALASAGMSSALAGVCGLERRGRMAADGQPAYRKCS
jgi:hypothetical protein